ncbi:hypothetical protein IQ268_04235 [Oculatella sp. LEGE 06141]|uniref:hypothetical protein n=1 Tax=Oculatella sp. LEGE 06141 TaxID=1828648 RepID=UPI001881768A|nr:hypothetical protein [Oculatella sp. LEGE 06141]MBE9177789.1 hypothetical protein [Oculatella sp. LEGE 06141]
MAVDLAILKTQYLQNDTATQINRLAANLAQIKAFAQVGAEEQRAQDLIRESQFFIEWVVPSLNLETEPDLATELVALQRQLSRWKLHFSTLWSNSGDRLHVAQLSQDWSDRLLSFSSLIAG